jgi:hypothetical protein
MTVRERTRLDLNQTGRACSTMSRLCNEKARAC